jgi:hypothetical protein
MAWAMHRLWPTEVSPAIPSAIIGHPFGLRSEQQLFHAPVLVSQLDLQVQHALADAIEAEMARFDHSGMHRSHGDLVDLITLYGIVVVSSGDIFAVVIAEDIRFVRGSWDGSAPS